METTLQILKRDVKDNYELAEKYYKVLSTVNDLNMAKREIQLVAYTAIEGNISDPILKNAFIAKHKSSKATIGNIVCAMKKIYVLVKDKETNKMVVNPAIALDFTKNINMELKLEHVEA
jgi:hypothetical protein